MDKCTYAKNILKKSSFIKHKKINDRIQCLHNVRHKIDGMFVFKIINSRYKIFVDDSGLFESSNFGKENELFLKEKILFHLDFFF